MVPSRWNRRIYRYMRAIAFFGVTERKLLVKRVAHAQAILVTCNPDGTTLLLSFWCRLAIIKFEIDVHPVCAGYYKLATGA